ADRLASAGAVLAVAILVALLSAAQIYLATRALGEAGAWSAALGSQLTFWLTWAAMLPLIQLVSRRVEGKGRISSIAAHVCLFAICALLTPAALLIIKTRDRKSVV